MTKLRLLFLACLLFLSVGHKAGSEAGSSPESHYVKHYASFADKLRDGTDPVSEFLRKQLTPKTQKQLQNHNSKCPLTEELQKSLLNELEGAISKSSFYDAEPFKQVKLTEETQRLLGNQSTVDVAQLNWLLLADAYPYDISKGVNPLDGQDYNPEDFPSEVSCYPKLSESDITKLLQTGEVFKRTIPARLLAKALAQPPRGKQSSKDLDITSCFVDGDLDLSNHEIFRGVLVANTNFNGELKLDHAKINDNFGLEPATVNYLSAEQTIFRGKFYVDGSTFLTGANFKSAQFLDSATFTNAKFKNDEGIENTLTDFSEVKFFKGATFDAVRFDTTTVFDSVVFHGGTAFDFAWFLGETTFLKTEFHDVVSFRSVTIARPLSFTQVTFPTSISFDGLHGIAPKIEPASSETPAVRNQAIRNDGPVAAESRPESLEEQRAHLVLEFYGTTFRGPTSFDGLDVSTLRFPVVKIESQGTRQLFSPLVCEKPISFSGMRSDEADFSNAEFQDHVDYRNAVFTRYANFNHATFRDTASFYKALFPEPPKVPDQKSHGVDLGGVRFFKPVNLNWKQLRDGRLTSNDPTTWATLEETFKSSGDLESQNEAYFQKRQLSREGLMDGVSYVFWGYGVRPLRLLMWISLVQLVFTATYWTQTRSIRPDLVSWQRQKARLAFAISFGLQTAITLAYGITNSRTLLFKTLTVMHMLFMKVLLLLLLVALANVSPLLHDILGKLLPI